MKNSKLFLYLGLGLFLSPIILAIAVRPAFWNGWDFSSTGQIGDTIGGILGPLINLLGAFLVYRSFLIQKAANEIQVKALKDQRDQDELTSNFDRLFELYKELKEDFYTLSYLSYYQVDKYSFSHRKEPYLQLEGLIEFADNIKTIHHDAILEGNTSIRLTLPSFLESLYFISLKTNTLKLSNEDRIIIQQKILTIYSPTFKDQIKTIAELDEYIEQSNFKSWADSIKKNSKKIEEQTKNWSDKI